jgi:carboxypeptidase Taq
MLFANFHRCYASLSLSSLMFPGVPFFLSVPQKGRVSASPTGTYFDNARIIREYSIRTGVFSGADAPCIPGSCIEETENVAIAQDSTEHNKANMPDFTHSDARISELLDRMREISALSALGSLASWDQNTIMPQGATEVRAAQMAVVQGILHERWTHPRLGSLLSELEEVVQSQTFTDADRGLVHEALRTYKHYAKLPRELVEEMARVEASSFDAWRRARTNNDFASFAPWLNRTISLQHEVADRLGYVETRYDALLDEYEPGLTASKLEGLFAPVREISTTLLQRIQASGHVVDTSSLQGDFPQEKQIELCTEILKHMGYDFSRGVIAQSPHPFTSGLGSPFDVRVTVRTHPHLLQQSIMAAIHEGGHALYEQGSAPTLVQTPVVGGASMGIHESQSRLWENAIGRSEPFWRGQFELVRRIFPGKYAHVDAATFARALNHVEPSLIRVEADEVTYNLHIIIRFEMEKAMVNGSVSIESLPRMWNEKYRDYLGIEPDSDSNGILQDVHWTSGFGYFPSYTLGNLYAAQILHTLRQALPDFDESLTRGDTSRILSWLREHMYIVGAIYQPDELIKRVTGASLDPTYFTRYLTDKFEQIYELK